MRKNSKEKIDHLFFFENCTRMLYAFIFGINFYSCTRYKLLCDYNSSSSSDTGSEAVVMIVTYNTHHRFPCY